MKTHLRHVSVCASLQEFALKHLDVVFWDEAELRLGMHIESGLVIKLGLNCSLWMILVIKFAP